MISQCTGLGVQVKSMAFFSTHTHLRIETLKERSKHEQSLPVVKSHRTFVIGMAWRPCQVLQFDAFNWRAHLRTFNLFQHTAAILQSISPSLHKVTNIPGIPSLCCVWPHQNHQRVGLHAGRFGLGALLLEPQRK